MARTKKKNGFWKIHQDCGVCQKPRRYRKIKLIKELIKEALKDGIWDEALGKLDNQHRDMI